MLSKPENRATAVKRPAGEMGIPETGSGDHPRQEQTNMIFDQELGEEPRRFPDRARGEAQGRRERPGEGTGIGQSQPSSTVWVRNSSCGPSAPPGAALGLLQGVGQVSCPGKPVCRLGALQRHDTPPHHLTAGAAWSDPGVPGKAWCHLLHILEGQGI